MWLFYTGIVVEHPIAMHVDNVGTIFLSDNTSVSKSKKHIDVRHHFICDYIEYGTVKIQFVRSEENLADPFTKDLINGPF